jgi:NNP family nitrate/nitrite transporter-like MFS transporter
MGEAKNSSLLSQTGPLLFLVGIFLINFLSRIVLSPLMPAIEKDLKIGHDEAGALFLILSLGYCVMLFGSGFVSSRFNHRRTIILSSVAVGGTLLVISVSRQLWVIRFGILILGMTAGLYLPSGIATLTGLVNPKDWGKAIAIHELAPNLGFVIAPLLAEALMGWFSWRGVLTVFGIASIIAGLLFVLFGKGGDFFGEAPNSLNLQNIVVEPSFWIMIVLFSFGIGASFGVYSMLPLYLVSEKGMERTWANTLLGLSRISALVIVLLSGWVTDRIGVRQTLKAVFLANGLATMILGVVSGSWTIVLLFIQPMIATCFFPAGFAALSRMGSPRIKNVAISFTASLGFLLGGGAIPAGIGLIGELGSFSLGFILLGALLFAGVILVQFLKFANE